MGIGSKYAGTNTLMKRLGQQRPYQRCSSNERRILLLELKNIDNLKSNFDSDSLFDVWLKSVNY